jgi:uncharacterized cofD-like protein
MKKVILVAGNEKLYDEVREALGFLDIGVTRETDADVLCRACRKREVALVIFDDDTFRLKPRSSREEALRSIAGSKKDFIVVSSLRSFEAVREARKYGAANYLLRPFNYREFISHVNAVLQKKTRIACIGGGTGLFHILLGLKKMPNVLLTSVVSMSDDGGSSGKLRASFGVLPPGDIRRSIVALSNAPEVMNRIMQYRFKEGDGLEGHNFGNLLLAVLTEIRGSFSEATKTTSDILNVQGIVLAVSDRATTLCARFEDGTVVRGESKIDLSEERNPNLHIVEIWHEPEEECNVEAFSAIVNSDFVVIGPGDLYTSIATNFVVKHVKEAVAETNASVVYICNLMTKPGETPGYTALDHVREVVRYTGGDHLDYVIISNTRIDGKAVIEYSKMNQAPVETGNVKEISRLTDAMVIVADVGHESELVRHDSEKIRKVLGKILRK